MTALTQPELFYRALKSIMKRSEQEKVPTAMTSYLSFHYFINDKCCTSKAAMGEKRRKNSSSTFPWSDGAYQVMKEYILRRVLSIRVYTTAAWAWSIPHHFTSFVEVNLPSDWAEIGGRPWQSFQPKDISHNQDTFRKGGLNNSYFHAE